MGPLGTPYSCCYHIIFHRSVNTVVHITGHSFWVIKGGEPLLGEINLDDSFSHCWSISWDLVKILE